MATLTFTVPNAALTVLDAYAQDKRFTDFHDMVAAYMKNTYRNARRELNQQQAKDLIAVESPEPTIT